MKRIVLIGMLLAAAAARAFDFSAVAPSGQTIYYSIIANSHNVSVVSPNDWVSLPMPTGVLEIPATVTNNGTAYHVTEIAREAFYACEGLTGVIIPQGVTRIGTMAFEQCTALDSIVLPSGLTYIGTNAFNGTGYAGLSQNHWNASGLLYIGPYLIAARGSLDGTVQVADSTILMANAAFIYCRNIDKIVIPSSVAIIGDNVFQGCSDLDTLSLLGAVPPTLGYDVFRDAGNVTVTVPCNSSATYNAAANWSALTIVEDCSPAVAIDGVETTTQPTVTTVDGGIEITNTEGITVTITDVMGRRIGATLGGHIALPRHGLYLMTTPEGSSKKIIY